MGCSSWHVWLPLLAALFMVVLEGPSDMSLEVVAGAMSCLGLDLINSCSGGQGYKMYVWCTCVFMHVCVCV